MTQDLGKLLHRGLRYVAVIVVTVVCVGLVPQATLEDVFEEIESLNLIAQQTLETVDGLNEDHIDLTHEYRSTLKSIDGQKVHNRSLDLRIAKQNDVLEDLRESIAEVDLIESQITPLMARMVEGLEQLVELDKPFLLEERTARVENLRDMLTQFNIEDSEKFSQVLRAYRQESEYGRTMDSSRQELELEDGKIYNVNILRVGRIALLYQTLDGKYTGWWNPSTKKWEELPGKFATPIKNGIKMANKQLSGGLFVVPIWVPEEEN